jgi:hypothetical protein
LKRKIFWIKKEKVKKIVVQRFKKMKKKKKEKRKKKKEKKRRVSVSVLKLRNFSWINCVLFGVLARLYLNNMAFEANILLLDHFVRTTHSN